MEKGNASPVVLLHGNQAMADDFEISGTFDSNVDIKSQPMRLRAVVPQSKLHVIDGTGHMLHHAYPKKVVAKTETLCSGPDLAHL